MNNIKKFVISLTCILLLYCYAFNPIYLPLSAMGLVKLTYVFLFFYFLKGPREVLKKYIPIVITHIFLIIYSLFASITGHNITALHSQIVDFIELFLIPIPFALFLIDKKVELSRLLIIIAIIASSVSMYAYLNDSFLYVLRLVQPIDEILLDSTLEIRSFGFSSELQGSYGWTLGLIVVYFLNYFSHYKWFIFFVPMICFVILINARTGFLVIISGLLIYTIFNLKIKTIVYILMAILSFYLLITSINLSWINEGSYKFIEDFFIQIRNVFIGNFEDTYISTYTGNMFILPNSLLEWVFGTGQNLFFGITGRGNSDVGYLNDLMFGGIIYVFLLYGLYYRIFRYAKPKWFLYFILLTILVLNVKAPILHTNGCLRIIILIIFYEYFKSKYCDNQMCYKSSL